ncbi:retrovirus-related pol polyprotein from transposon TNT 1-94 [Tanacetum coccineum]
MINRSPSTTIELKIPMEMWTRKPINYSDLHIFGSHVYVMYNTQETTKLDPKSRKCLFLRLADGVNWYRLWDPTAHKVVVSRDVVFMENKIQENEEAAPQHEVNKTNESQALRTHTLNRERRRPGWHSDYVIESNVAYCLLTGDGEPLNLQGALNNLDASFWKEAMQEEIKALHKNKTWELVPLPGGRKPIGNKWVYKIKKNAMIRWRVVLAMCATYDLHLEHLDVKTVFLHGNLEEEIYMLQREGFKQKEKENLVCRLNKSPYGLKQAPRCWYKRFDSFIRSLEYNRLHADPCAYFKRFRNDDFIIFLLYVDDMLVTGPNKDRINKLKLQLAREFKMKDLGPANKILGMQIHQDRVSRKIWLSQKSYVKKILQRFNMQDCKPISTPFPTNVKLSSKMSPSSEKKRMKISRVPYASAVGSLMFEMICTRPDIAHAVRVVSRYMAKPGREHWEAMKRILRYIKGTSDVALCFGESDLIVKGYVDSDYAGDLDGSKSTTRIAVIMEYLGKISKKARILERERRHLKILTLTSYTPYPSRKIRRINALALSDRHPTYHKTPSDRVKIDYPNITMEEYIRLEEEKARRREKVYNWETATYGKILYDEDVLDLRSVETEFPVIAFNDSLTSGETPSCEPTVNFEKEFSAIVYNDALTSKLDFLTEPTVSPQHIDEFNLKDETSLSECDEEEQKVLNFNDLFPFNVIYPNDSKSDKDNDDDKVDVGHSSGDLFVKPLPDAINTDVGAYAHGTVYTAYSLNEYSVYDTSINTAYPGIKMDEPNITMKEYTRLEEEKAHRRGKVYNWEIATYGKIWDNEDVHDLGSVETEFPAIVFNDTLTSEATLSCEPTVSSLNNNKIDFRIWFDESDDEDYTIIFDKNSFSHKIIYANDLKTDSENDNEKVNMPSLPSPEPTVSCFDDLDFFNDLENEFPAIVYNDAQTSKLDDLDYFKDFEKEFSAIVYNDAPMSKSVLLTEPILSPQHIDEFNLKSETSLSECDEEEQNILYFNDLFPLNVVYPNDLKSDKDNDDDKVDIKHSSGNFSVKSLPDVINNDVGANAHGTVYTTYSLNEYSVYKYQYGVSWGMDTEYRLPVQFLGTF